MNRMRLLVFVFVAIALVLVLAVAARAAITQQNLTGGVIVVRSYALNETYAGDLVVASGEVIVGAEAEVAGNASFVGENVRFAGQVEGDLTILAPQVNLAGARVGGRLHILADQVIVNAQVSGEAFIESDTLTIVDGATFASDPAVCAEDFTDERASGGVADCPPRSVDPFANLRALRSAVNVEGPALILPSLLPDVILLLLVLATLTAFAPLAVTLIPARVTRVARAMRRRPVQSLLTGAGVFALIAGLTGVQIALLGTISFAGLVALPVYAVAVLGTALLIAVGLVALALLIGVRLTGADQDGGQPPLVAAAVGGLIVAGCLLIVALQPLGQTISIVAFIALAILGAGAALGTRLGASPSGSARPR
ncbi:MAG: polymer-forming cytoskeletal protein [Chloroflexi bacterium]|nr:polymer-forming cytoskeletal protein [Chloroflexota bacterium]